MADPLPNPDSHPDTSDDASSRLNGGSPLSTPRWVKVLGITALVLVLLIVIVMVISGGQHGPGRRMPGGVMGGYTPPSSVTEQRVRQL
jgi:hypothetical protein